MAETNKRDFDTAALTWDDNPGRIKMTRAIADAILNRVGATKDMDVMDYGAGTGLVTLALQPSVRSIVAVDSSNGMLARLKEKVDAAGLTNVQVKYLDLERDAAPGGEFDLVISTMTMHHVNDVAGMVKALWGLLKENGCLAIADLDLDDGEFHQDPTGVRHNGFDRGDIARYFRDAGLEEVKVETAFTMTKEVAGKGCRDFSIFLASGCKAEG